MTAQRYYFADFVLDRHERQLFLKGQQLELNSRYLDALLLLVQEPGKLVSKERFFTEVWQDVVVSDEALTQCIRTLRRLLQDKAAAPVFIETVPKHGYRFIAQVSQIEPPENQSRVQQPAPKRQAFAQALSQLTGAGLLGAALAGICGGALYGINAALLLLPSGGQSGSVLLVMLCITLLIALLGGAAVSFGLAVVSLWQGRTLFWLLLGGGIAGSLVGAFVNLLLSEAFLLFFGSGPAQLTGAAEGLVVGLAAALSCWLQANSTGIVRLLYALVPGLVAGALLSFSGGLLLAGSLVQLLVQFPQGAVSALVTEIAFQGAAHQPVLTLTAMFETALFCAGLTLAQQRALLTLSAERKEQVKVAAV